LFNAGADAPLTFSLSGDTSGLPTLHSGGVLVTYAVVGNELIASAGSETVFTLTVNPDGSWSFDLVGALDHPAGNFENNIDLDLGSVIVATDADGDSAPAADGAFIVTVDDDLPTAVTPPENPQDPNGPPLPIISGAVDEDDLPQGNSDVIDSSDDLADPSPTTVGGNAGSLAALFNAGADIPLQNYGLVNDTSGLPHLTSNGHDVQYSINSDTGVLTAVADLDGDGSIEAGETIFTLTVNPDGSWSFQLQGQLDHPVAGTEDNLILDFSSIVTAEDADHDPVVAAVGSFVINVDDDMPQPFNEENCPQVTVVNADGSHAVGQFDLPNVGADEPAKFTFDVTDGQAVVDSGGNPITAEGQPLFYFVNDTTGLLEAHEGSESGALVFTIALNPDGSFEYNQLIDIDNGGSGISFENLTSTSAGNVEFRGVGANNPATTVDLLLSADDNGTDSTVNTDSDSVGTANQSTDVGQTIRIDFVSDLVTGDAGNPSGFDYGNHVSSNSFTGLIPQVQANQDQTVAFTVWALDSSNT
jgi:T1SS-143 domain-containing protein